MRRAVQALKQRPFSGLTPPPEGEDAPQGGSLDAEAALKSFCAFARQALARYQSNAQAVSLCDQLTQDILHDIELSPGKNAAQGYAAYSQLRKARQERRRAKTENFLLNPLKAFLDESPALLNQLSKLQGECRLAKERAARFRYVSRFPKEGGSAP